MKKIRKFKTNTNKKQSNISKEQKKYKAQQAYLYHRQIRIYKELHLQVLKLHHQATSPRYDGPTSQAWR